MILAWLDCEMHGPRNGWSSCEMPGREFPDNLKTRTERSRVCSASAPNSSGSCSFDDARAQVLKQREFVGVTNSDVHTPMSGSAREPKTFQQRGPTRIGIGDRGVGDVEGGRDFSAVAAVTQHLLTSAPRHESAEKRVDLGICGDRDDQCLRTYLSLRDAHGRSDRQCIRC